MNELTRLERHLRRHFVIDLAREEQFRPPAELTARIAAVRQSLAPPRGHYSDSRIAQGIMAFRLHGRATPYPDLKYACYGIARAMDWEGRILLADEALVGQLLAAVTALKPRPRLFSACCRGLAAAWQNDIKGNHALLSSTQTRNAVASLNRFIKEHPPAPRPIRNAP